MELNDFLKKFEEQFEDGLSAPLTAETKYQDLQEWDSLTSLAVIAMVDHVFKKQLTGDELSGAANVADLYRIIQTK